MFPAKHQTDGRQSLCRVLLPENKPAGRLTPDGLAEAQQKIPELRNKLAHCCGDGKRHRETCVDFRQKKTTARQPPTFVAVAVIAIALAN